MIADLCKTLGRYKVVSWGREAVEYLERLQLLLNLVLLFRDCFPEDFHSTLGSESADIEEIEAAIDRFFILVDDCYFPIIEIGDDFLPNIPFYPIGFDFWLDDPDQFRDSLHFLLGIYDREFRTDEWVQKFPLDIVPCEYISASLLEEICRNESQPLSFLYDAILLVDHSTNNLWLDCTSEEDYSFPWEREVLEKLAEQYNKALAYWERVDALCDWLEESSVRLHEVVRLWNRASTHNCPISTKAS